MAVPKAALHFFGYIKIIHEIFSLGGDKRIKKLL
jgi:hypothetical protein